MLDGPVDDAADGAPLGESVADDASFVYVVGRGFKLRFYQGNHVRMRGSDTRDAGQHLSQADE